jgi:uncharacterized protein
MESLKRLEPLWLGLMIVGALNWGVIALFDTNVLTEIFGSGTLTDIVYCIVAFAGLMMVPALLERMHLGALHRPRAHAS